ncbi:Uncharacterised protein [Mesomycoplasma dispar]|uniref:HNH domain-containing protein n=2 Tax=Mesomycoplasma dispar TaxID=86660 RepID=A0AAJ5NSK0_9BACT|nr:hypothetical protein MDIS_02770 [Mesomycoplasma dispar]VEU62069.1 Uncharacterised protein [Mesomycoplasma dispar]
MFYNKNMKISELLNLGFSEANLKLVFFIFFNLANKTQKEEKCYFQIEIQYKNLKNKNIVLDNDIAVTNNENFENYTGLKFEFEKYKHFSFIENDINISREYFLTKIYQIIMKWYYQEQSDEYIFQKCLFLALFAFRGSLDIPGKMWAVDIRKKDISINYIDNLYSLLLTFGEIEFLNLNFRELQPDYVTGKNKRNLQIRIINLQWFFEKFGNDLKKINVYKYLNFENNLFRFKQTETKQKIKRSNFVERLIFYKKHVLNWELKSQDWDESRKNNEINKIRKILFENNLNIYEKFYTRNQKVVEIARILLNHFCFGCKDEYPLENRSFIQPKTGKLYLEIHHVLPFSKQSDLKVNVDIIENLVKLCPVCHSALKKGRSNNNYQKKIIDSILKNSNKSLISFLNSFVENKESISEKIDFIHKNLA